MGPSGSLSQAALLSAATDTRRASPEDNDLLGAQFDALGNLRVAWATYAVGTAASFNVSASMSGGGPWVRIPPHPAAARPNVARVPGTYGYAVGDKRGETFVQSGADSMVRATDRFEDGSWSTSVPLGRERQNNGLSKPALRSRGDQLTIGWTGRQGVVIATR